MEQDIRWKQRFENYEKALKHLEFALIQVKQPSDLEKHDTIHRFEFTHDLAWKVMKDFLQSSGVKDIFGSRDATRQAFSAGLISEGQSWMNMIESRNATVHTYKDEILQAEYIKIKESYFPLLKAFYYKMKTFL